MAVSSKRPFPAAVSQVCEFSLHFIYLVLDFPDKSQQEPALQALTQIRLGERDIIGGGGSRHRRKFGGLKARWRKVGGN